MGNFQGNGGGGNRGGGGGRSNYRGDRDEVTMHKAICDECHKNCEVPFRPSGDKPVYCNECFSNKRASDDRGPRRDFGDRGPKRDFNDRSGQSSFAKPVGAQNDTTKQLTDISTKLDRLLGAMEKLMESKQEAIRTPIVKTSTKKVATKKKTK